MTLFKGIPHGKVLRSSPETSLNPPSICMPCDLGLIEGWRWITVLGDPIGGTFCLSLLEEEKKVRSRITFVATCNLLQMSLLQYILFSVLCFYVFTCRLFRNLLFETSGFSFPRWYVVWFHCDIRHILKYFSLETCFFFFFSQYMSVLVYV